MSSEAAIIAEIHAAAERQGVSKDAIDWLDEAARRAQRLVFREIRQVAAVIPQYEVGYFHRPVIFIPSTKALDALGYLHLLVKARGRWVSVELGRQGYSRRTEMVRKRLQNAAKALSEIAPTLAEELGRIKIRSRSTGVFACLPGRSNSPTIEV